MNLVYCQACNLPDFSNPVSVKNHNEVLRCFSVLSKYCPGGGEGTISRHDVDCETKKIQEPEVLLPKEYLASQFPTPPRIQYLNTSMLRFSITLTLRS